MFYKRNLPHWHPENRCIFLTWRLYGSLPVGFVRGLRLRSNLSPAEEFRLAEKLLDRATEGPLWLKNPAVAGAVMQVLQRGALEFRHYDLHAYCIMANHVHALLTPLARIRNITRSVKGIAAASRQSTVASNGRAILAGRVIRSLGPQRRRILPHSEVYRKQSGESRAGHQGRKLAMVKRL